jgi:hypothetical protein
MFVGTDVSEELNEYHPQSLARRVPWTAVIIPLLWCLYVPLYTANILGDLNLQIKNLDSSK